jgi:hypothetical protein
MSQARWLTLSVLLVLAAGSLRADSNPDAELVSSLGAEQLSELKCDLRESSLVALGRVVSADTRWVPYLSSLGLPMMEFKLRIEKRLKGTYQAKSVVVAATVIGAPWAEAQPDRGLRLRPEYFRKGRALLVLLDRSPMPGEVLFDVVGRPGQGIWPGSEANIGDITSLLREIESVPPGDCEKGSRR